MNRTDTKGNVDLVSSDEDLIVEYLKKNLVRVNAESKEVNVSNGFYVKYIKRLLDIMISLPACLILLPLNCLFGLCTFLDVGLPIIYKQTRVGKDHKLFTIYKFRNMRNTTDADGILLPPSQRVTGFGKIMRKFSLDELLNFWSVLVGDMSIIGPRPLPVTFTDRMSERHKKRNAVRPGLECPRYISIREEWSKYQNQFENDIWYVENVSFINDVKLILLLFKMTFNFTRRSENAKGGGYFVGYDDDCGATTLKRFIKMHPDQWAEIKSNNLNK